MKGIQGVIIAIGLSIAGAILNWAYLASRSSEDATVSFLGIKEGQVVNRGDILRDEHLAELTIPERWVGNMRGFAVLSNARTTVVGRPVWRSMTGECLLLNEDLKTPPQGLRLEEGEQIMWIPVESRAFVPSLISPGDEVMFLVPRWTRSSSGKPSPGNSGDNLAVQPSPSGNTTEIGPFRVRTLGNRLGSAEVWQAAKLSQLQENVIGIGVKPQEKKMALALWDILQATNYHHVGIEKLGPVQNRQAMPQDQSEKLSNEAPQQKNAHESLVQQDQ